MCRVADERLTFGTYCLRFKRRSRTRGFFYYSRSMSRAEVAALKRYGAEAGVKVMERKEFIATIFYPAVYRANAVCVGYDLPFVLSRLAIRHGPARRKMRGGFSLQLRPEKWPRLRIKRLTARAASTSFASSRFNRNEARYGYFADVKTLAGALLGGAGRMAPHMRREPLGP